MSALHWPEETSKKMTAKGMVFLLLTVSLASPSSANLTKENFYSTQPPSPPLPQSLLAGQKLPSPLPPLRTRAAESSVVSLRRKRQAEDEEEEESRAALDLSALVTTVAKKELKDCVLGIATDQGFRDSAVLEDLLRLPNLRQVRGRRKKKHGE